VNLKIRNHPSSCCSCRRCYFWGRVRPP
jgi:hypothetical protein